jgi:hypothetical protein
MQTEKEVEILDITEPEVVEIVVRKDKKVVWVNTESGCVLRACRIKTLTITQE